MIGSSQAPPGISLKAFSLDLAPYLNLTPLAVYERQRTLARLGVLPFSEGKGPNRGVKATATTVAPLLISALCADDLGDIKDRVVALLNAKPTDMETAMEDYTDQQAHLDSAARQMKALGRKWKRPSLSPPRAISCSITGAATLSEAVSALLASEEMTGRVAELVVNRTTLTAAISTTDGTRSDFGLWKTNSATMEIEARLHGDQLVAIASKLAALSTITERSS